MTARDHGVTPEYVRGLKDLGYSQLSIEELRTLRDHGATPESVKRANDKAGTEALARNAPHGAGRGDALA